ncbi:MAG TPA: response regulator [Thermodesulfovibrionales bacterium]|nr:response regulator [Thermodesulfovibrionales bacterium]
MVYKLHSVHPMERALIVNDDQLMSYAISKALQPYHPEIKTVSNGDDAIAEISSCFYPLCFLDVSVPGLHGSDMVRKIRELSPDTKVVVFTPEERPVNGAKDFIGEKIDENACFCLQKPFEISELKAVVQQALNKKEQEPFSLNKKDQKFFSADKRIPRRPLKKCVSYTVIVLEQGKPVSLTLKGDIIDISDKGVGMRTHYPLEPGHYLMFDNETELKSGVVKWISPPDDSYMYRVGVEFLEL